MAGIATGTPDGGVAIIRISGPAAGAIGTRLTGALPEPRVLALRRLDGESVLVGWMPAPRSFTGEDVVELHVHAGARNVQSVLAQVLEAGAVAAGAGDFTRRAFEHGRLSLDQAEGIAALIGARTQAALDHAKRLLAGELGREVETVRAAIERLRVEIEAHLDFPDDIGAGDQARWQAEARRIREAVTGWLARFEQGRRARNRARVVLAGPPNAGKSALFNALIGRRRTLVSDQPGTTRDFIEAELELAGRELTLVDTAGLRTGDDALERDGIALGREQLAGAELIVWIEAADEVDRPEWTAERQALSDVGTLLAAETKIDLGRQRPDWLGVSIREPATLDPLRSAIVDALGDVANTWIGLARHRDRAAETAEALVETEELLAAAAGLELVGFALAVAQQRIGEITGHTGLGPVGGEVLDAIFSRFCIGK